MNKKCRLQVTRNLFCRLGVGAAFNLKRKELLLLAPESSVAFNRTKDWNEKKKESGYLLFDFANETIEWRAGRSRWTGAGGRGRSGGAACAGAAIEFHALEIDLCGAAFTEARLAAAFEHLPRNTSSFR